MNERMKQRMGASVATPFLMAGALVGACTTTSEDVAPTLATTNQEIAQLMSADSAYMAKAFETKARATGGSVEMTSIDMADPGQHRFVMNRLAAAGKNKDNSPALFDRLDKNRARALAAKAAKADGSLVTSVTATAANWCAQFVIIGAETKPTATTIGFNGTHADVSCLGGAAYVYADVTTFNSNRAGTENFVVGSAAGEDYTGGTNFNLVEINPALPAQLGRVNRTDSLMIAYDETGAFEQVTFSSVVSEIVPTPGSILLQHPVIHPFVQNGGEIQMCQLRGTEAQCDYRIGNLNVSGAFAQFATPINRIAAVASINPWVADQTQLFAFPNGFTAGNVYLPTVGVLDVGATPTGNCSIKSITSAKFHLFKTVTGGVCDTVAELRSKFVLTSNPRKATFATVSDFTNNGGTSSPPGVNCSLTPIINERVKPSLVIQAGAHCGEFNSNGTPKIIQRVITLSPEGSTPIPNFVKFVNSCFAEGTKIRKPNGSLATVEKFKVGDKVVADSKGTVLTVTAISKGIEEEPIVDVRDSKGHALRLTSQHPVVKASGEVVYASSLRKDDRVMTDRGIATITSVERVAYKGQVYNLELGTAEERAKVGKNGTTMYAGGFLVGDATMQEEHSKPRPVVANLPAEWKRDYENALKNNPPMMRVLR
jgi:hypothetical protein